MIFCMKGPNAHRPQLCLGCPLVPKGVVAELTDLTVLTDSQMTAIKYRPKNGSEHLRAACATFTVTASTNPSVKVGEVAEQHYVTHGQSRPQIEDHFAACEAPPKRGIVAKVLGSSAVCNGLPPY